MRMKIPRTFIVRCLRHIGAAWFNLVRLSGLLVVYWMDLLLQLSLKAGMSLALKGLLSL